MLSDGGAMDVSKDFCTLYHNQTNTVSVTNIRLLHLSNKILIIRYLYNWHIFLLQSVKAALANPVKSLKGE